MNYITSDCYSARVAAQLTRQAVCLQRNCFKPWDQKYKNKEDIMAKRRKQNGPRFLRFFNPVIEALQDLGGSGRPSEVVDWIASKMDVSEEEQSEQLASGQSRFANEIHWARFYLAKTRYIDSSRRGVWSLTNSVKLFLR